MGSDFDSSDSYFLFAEQREYHKGALAHSSSFIAVLHFTVTVVSRVFNNVYNSSPKMSVKQTLACSWAILNLCQCKATSGNHYCSDVIWCIEFYFAYVGVINKKTKHGWSNLTNTVIIIVEWTDDSILVFKLSGLN